MVKIILYSENEGNIKKIKTLLEGRDEFTLKLGKMSQPAKEDKALDDAGLLILDLTGSSMDNSNLKNGIKKINGMINMLMNYLMIN